MNLKHIYTQVNYAHMYGGMFHHIRKAVLGNGLYIQLSW